MAKRSTYINAYHPHCYYKCHAVSFPKPAEPIPLEARLGEEMIRRVPRAPHPSLLEINKLEVTEGSL